MLPLLALLLALPFPIAGRTSWMRPESFRLTVGMPRTDAMRELADTGWHPKPGKGPDQFVVEYGDDRALTIDFRNDRLQSIRFELFVFLPDARKAFEEEKRFLRETAGQPASIRSKSIVLYDRNTPNIMVVVADDPKSENGKKGLGLLVVRYFAPAGRN